MKSRREALDARASAQVAPSRLHFCTSPGRVQQHVGMPTYAHVSAIHQPAMPPTLTYLLQCCSAALQKTSTYSIHSNWHVLRRTASLLFCRPIMCTEASRGMSRVSAWVLKLLTCRRAGVGGGAGQLKLCVVCLPHHSRHITAGGASHVRSMCIPCAFHVHVHSMCILLCIPCARALSFHPICAPCPAVGAPQSWSPP